MTGFVNSKFETVNENIRFMVHEVVSQVEQTLQFFAEPSRSLVEKINARDNYVDSLKGLILDKIYDILLHEPALDKNKVNLLRCLNTIVDNLERIADFSVNMIRQAQHLSDIFFLQHFDYEVFFEEVLAGLERIQAALDRREMALAFRICQCEFNLDELYGRNFQRILSGLRSGGDTGNLITCLMILHYLERMGDSLLNIGEAIIFAQVGEKMKIQQYRALTETLSSSGLETPISEVEFESIWGTRSGCRIGVVGEKSEEDSARPVLFKHGELKKLEKEKENIERWEELAPGLPPEVCGFVAGEDGNGSILLEYLPGCTFQELVVTGSQEMMMDALFMVEETVGQIWRTTMKQEKVRAGFIRQIRDRMDAVYRVHPQFKGKSSCVGDLKIRSFGELIREIEQIERNLNSPFSVFIHGDFNINNIIYDSYRERIHFIDLHRSRQTDYIQDVSVILISLFRLPFFVPAIRARLNYAIMDFFEFAKNFSIRFNDDTFEVRLALGLARSLFTSTRFELNSKFAKRMLLISTYLMERISDHSGRPWEDFELPGETLIY